MNNKDEKIDTSVITPEKKNKVLKIEKMINYILLKVKKQEKE